MCIGLVDKLERVAFLGDAQTGVAVVQSDLLAVIVRLIPLS